MAAATRFILTESVPSHFGTVHSGAGDPDPLRNLPNGFKIGIFVGQEINSVRRAQTILTQRNPTLDVRIMAAADMDVRVQSLARQVDWAIVINTYISHAIFYGIKEYLAEDPLYPRSRGSTAIVNAVEARTSAPCNFDREGNPRHFGRLTVNPVRLLIKGRESDVSRRWPAW